MSWKAGSQRDGDAVRDEREKAVDIGRIVEEVPVTDHDALRFRGGAGSVLEQRHGVCWSRPGLAIPAPGQLPVTLSVANQRIFCNSGACVNRPSVLERIADVVSTTEGCASPDDGPKPGEGPLWLSQIGRRQRDGNHPGI